MHRGLGIPGRVRKDDNGLITAPATDEAFMREYIQGMETADEGAAQPRGAARGVTMIIASMLRRP